MLGRQARVGSVESSGTTAAPVRAWREHSGSRTAVCTSLSRTMAPLPKAPVGFVGGGRAQQEAPLLTLRGMREAHRSREGPTGAGAASMRAGALSAVPLASRLVPGTSQTPNTHSAQ